MKKEYTTKFKELLSEIQKAVNNSNPCLAIQCDCAICPYRTMQLKCACVHIQDTIISLLNQKTYSKLTVKRLSNALNEFNCEKVVCTNCILQNENGCLYVQLENLYYKE